MSHSKQKAVNWQENNWAETVLNLNIFIYQSLGYLFIDVFIFIFYICPWSCNTCDCTSVDQFIKISSVKYLDICMEISRYFPSMCEHSNRCKVSHYCITQSECIKFSAPFSNISSINRHSVYFKGGRITMCEINCQHSGQPVQQQLFSSGFHQLARWL